MFGEIVSWLLSGSKGSVLGHAPSLNYVSMMVQKVAVLAGLKYFARPGIFFADISGGLQPPEVLKDRLIEFVIDDGQAQIFKVLLELRLRNDVASWGTVQFLDRQDSLLDLFPDIFFKLATRLDVWMVSEVKAFFNLSKVSSFFSQLHLAP